MNDPMDSYKGMGVTWDGDRAVVNRVTREARVRVVIGRGPREEPSLGTGLAFFDHMLEMIGWHGALNLTVEFERRTFALRHVVCEDIGLAMGMGAAALLRRAMADGVEGGGTAWRVMDEASAFAGLSFEGRSMSFIARESDGAKAETVEDMTGADMVAFYEGFAQGARCTLHLRAVSGNDPHHTWEAVARAFAVALKGCFDANPFRAGLTVGVKGTLD
jgi:imidazoleglycerol-phosphate dehydratase